MQLYVQTYISVYIRNEIKPPPTSPTLHLQLGACSLQHSFTACSRGLPTSDTKSPQSKQKQEAGLVLLYSAVSIPTTRGLLTRVSPFIHHQISHSSAWPSLALSKQESQFTG